MRATNAEITSNRTGEWPDFVGSVTISGESEVNLGNKCVASHRRSAKPRKLWRRDTPVRLIAVVPRCSMVFTGLLFIRSVCGCDIRPINGPGFSSYP